MKNEFSLLLFNHEQQCYKVIHTPKAYSVPRIGDWVSYYINEQCYASQVTDVIYHVVDPDMPYLGGIDVYLADGISYVSLCTDLRKKRCK